MSKKSYKKSLSSRTKFICGVITFKDWELYDLPMDELRDWFNAYADQWAFIPHFHDFDEDGNLKSLHIHFVADLTKSTRMSTTLNSLAQVCSVNPFAVTIEQYTSFDSCIQYLVHRNDPEKTQYCAYLITSNISWVDLKTLLQTDVDVVDAERIYAVVSSATCKSDVLRELGLFYYHRYRGVINDLWVEVHGSPLVFSFSE